MQTARMQRFIVRAVYYLIWAGLAIVCLQWLLPALAPFVAGFALAFCLRPAVKWMQRRCGASRRVLSITVMALFYAVLGVALVLAALRCALWAQQALAALPAFYRTAIQPTLQAAQQALHRLAQQLSPSLAPMIQQAGQGLSSAAGQWVASFSGQAVSNLARVLPGFLLRATLCVVSSFFFAADYDRIAAFCVRRLPGRWQAAVKKLHRISGQTLARLARAYLLLMAITFAEVWAGLWLLRVPGAAGWAALTALVDLLPILGSGSVLVPWAVIQLLAGRWTMGLGLLLLFGVLSTVRQILEPRLVGIQLGLHPLAALISMFAGLELFGFWGLVLCPLALTAAVQLSRAETLADPQKEKTRRIP